MRTCNEENIPLTWFVTNLKKIFSIDHFLNLTELDDEGIYALRTFLNIPEVYFGNFSVKSQKAHEFIHLFDGILKAEFLESMKGILCQPWMFGHCSAGKAEKLLAAEKPKKSGTFLVRMDEDFRFTLSFMKETSGKWQFFHDYLGNLSIPELVAEISKKREECHLVGPPETRPPTLTFLETWHTRKKKVDYAQEPLSIRLIF